MRTSWEYAVGYEESPVVHQVLARVATLTGYPYANVEPLIVLRYEPGNFFKLHHDGAFRPMSLFAYLNDVAEGGETHFPYLGVKVCPVAGTAIMWSNVVEGDGGDGKLVADHRVEHEGLPPAEGCIKYAMAIFVNSGAMHDASHIRIVDAPELEGDA
jgi:prolyl 4-hydroxylase